MAVAGGSGGDAPAQLGIFECAASLLYQNLGQRLFQGLAKYRKGLPKVSDTQKIDQELDARGLKCPLPVLKARKAMKAVPPGGLLRVLATDPNAVEDFQAFCRTTGDHLLESIEEEALYRFLLRKKA